MRRLGERDLRAAISDMPAFGALHSQKPDSSDAIFTARHLKAIMFSSGQGSPIAACTWPRLLAQTFDGITYSWRLFKSTKNNTNDSLPTSAF